MTITDQRSQGDVVRQIVTERVRRLQNGYLANRSAEVAALARLRRGLGKPPGTVLDILELTEAREFVRDLRDDRLTPSEVAAHQSLTLYAAHQQSQSEPMHRSGHRLGRSLRKLAPRETDIKPENPIVRRFTMVGTADSSDELLHHLRGAVQLLRSARIPLDYGLLASELMTWQYTDGPPRVRLRWGRDFYTFTPIEQTDKP